MKDGRVLQMFKIQRNNYLVTLERSTCKHQDKHSYVWSDSVTLHRLGRDAKQQSMNSESIVVINLEVSILNLRTTHAQNDLYHLHLLNSVN